MIRYLAAYGILEPKVELCMLPFRLLASLFDTLLPQLRFPGEANILADSSAVELYLVACDNASV